MYNNDKCFDDGPHIPKDNPCGNSVEEPQSRGFCCDNCASSEPEIPEQEIPQQDISEFANGINTSPAGSNSALLLIDRLPKYEFRITSFNFPSVMANQVTFSTPPVVGVFKVSPVKLEWGDINVTALLSEDYSNYFAIYNWMWENIHTLEHKEMNSEGRILILNNQKQIIRRINLIAMFPIALEELKIEMSNAEPLFFNARFKIDMFDYADASGLKFTPSYTGNL